MYMWGVGVVHNQFVYGTFDSSLSCDGHGATFLCCNRSLFCAYTYGGPQMQYTKLNSTTQNSIPLHKTKFHYTKQNSTTQNKIHDTQNSIPQHKTQFRYKKLNSTTQNKIPLHKTKFHYTKQNSTTQNKIHDTQNSIPQHKTQFRYTKQNSTTRNKIPLHKTKFTIHKTQFHNTKLNSTTQNSLLNAKSTDEANTMIDKPPLSTLLDLAGTFKFVSSLDEIPTLVQQTVKWFLLGRSHFSRAVCVRNL